MFELITGEVLHAPRPHAGPVLATTAAHLSVLGAVIAVPMLLLTEQLPDVPTVMAFVAASPAPPPPPPPRAPAVRKSVAADARPVANPQAAPLLAPDSIEPEPVAADVGEEAVPDGVEGGIAGGVPGGVLGGLPTEVPAPPPPPPPPPAPRGPVRIGGQIQAPALLRRVEPIYPSLAVSAHLEGLVILEAVVDRDGTVADAKVLRSAGALLDRQALVAIRQWRYSPLLLNGIKERFILTVTFTFSLKQPGPTD